jgi:hypothetical protein
VSFPEVSHIRFLMRHQFTNVLSENSVLFLQFFTLGFSEFLFMCWSRYLLRGECYRFPTMKMSGLIS